MLRRPLALLQETILAFPRTVLIGSTILVVVALVLGTQVEFRTSRRELAPDGDPDQARMDRIMGEFRGRDALIVALEAAPGAPKTASQLHAFADALASALRKEPSVENIYYRVDLDWFFERALWLIPPKTLRAAADAARNEKELIAGITGARGLPEINEAIARRIEESLASPAASIGAVDPAEAAEFIGYFSQFLDWQRRFLEEPAIVSAALGPGSSISPLAPLASFADGDPRLAGGGYLATRDGSMLFMIVSPGAEVGDLSSQRLFVSGVRGVADRLSEAKPGFRVGLAGDPAMNVEEMNAVRRDTWFTAGAAVLGVTLLTMLAFRWLTHAVLALVAIGAGVSWAFGAVFFELGYLNLITTSFLSTLVGVGVAYAIHPVSEYELEGAHTGDAREAVRIAYHRTGAPATVSALTTAAAFFSILLMKFRGFAELGLVSGIGVLLCLFACLVTLPALLVVHGHWRARRERRSRERRSGDPKSDGAVGSGAGARVARSALDRLWVERGAGLVCRFPKAVSAAALALTAALGWNAFGIGFSTNIFDLLPGDAESIEVHRRMLLESDLSPLFALAEAPDTESLRRMEERARAEPTVERFESLLRFLPENPEEEEATRASIAVLAGVLDELEPAAAVLPIDRVSLARSYERLEDAFASASESAFASGFGDLAGALEKAWSGAEAARGIVASSPAGLEPAWNEGQANLQAWLRQALDVARRATLSEPPVTDSLPLEIRERFLTRSGNPLGFVYPAGDVFDPEFLESFVAAARRISPEATGFPVVFNTMSRHITSGFSRAVAVGAVLMALILMIDMRNLRDVILAAIPLGIGLLWTLGGMGLLGISYNFANMVAVPLILGVGIDSGVHVVHRMRLEGEEGMSVVLRHTGRAILIASLTTMIGFGSLALADHRGIASLGTILLLGVGSCLVTSTIVLPNLLVVFGLARR